MHRQGAPWSHPVAMPPTRFDRLLAPVIERRFLAALERWQVGRLTVHLPGGRVVHFGQDPLPDVTLWIAREAFFRKLALGGDIGAGEAFIDGDWRTDDLVTLIDLLLRNRAYLAIPSRLGRLFRLADDWRHKRGRQTRSGIRRAFREHYDLSNEFFAA